MSSKKNYVQVKSDYYHYKKVMNIDQQYWYCIYSLQFNI